MNERQDTIRKIRMDQFQRRFKMKILSYNPGHDGAFAYVEDGHLVFSIEAEKSSKGRNAHTPL
jgi:hypothetical protein